LDCVPAGADLKSRPRSTRRRDVKIQAKDPDSYIAAIDPERRPQLQKLRGLVRTCVPDAHEAIMWGMIGYEHEGRPFAALASQKNYMSIYLMDLYNEPSLRDKHQAALSKLQMGKSCINFDSVDELPLEVIGDVLRA